MEELNVYEIITILDADLTESEIKAEIKDISNYINHGIETEPTITTYIHSIEKLGTKNLAYEIERRGKTHTKGYYVVFTYATNQTRVNQLENLLRKDHNIIKFVTVKIENPDIINKANISVHKQTHLI